MLFPPSVCIVPTAGDYLVLDKLSESKPTHILEYEPETKEKGLTVVPTTEGSLLLGPSERDHTLDYATTESGLAGVRALAKRLLPELDLENTIRSFAAVRPNPLCGRQSAKVSTQIMAECRSTPAVLRRRAED